MVHVLRRLPSVEASDAAVVAAAPAMAPREVFRRFWPCTRGGRRWLVPVLLFSLVGPAVNASEIVCSGVLRFADDVTSTWVGERFLLSRRADVFRHDQGLSLGFFERRRLGDVLSRITGDVDAVETFLLSGVADARGLSSLGNAFYAASASTERIIELQDQRPQIVEAPGARRNGRARGDVEFDGVWFRCPGAASWALSDVPFHVASGETLALVGASGAGKSTVAKLQLRFYDPDRGAVLLDGTDLRGLSLSAVRENVAVVLQEILVFHGTVRENIAYGLPDATDADVVSAARAADAHGFIERLSEGCDTLVGQRGRTLSGGQCQRLAIARATISDTPVRLLDEPTTGLDVRSGRRIMDPLRRPMAGRTTVVISHNLLTVRVATRNVVLDHGRIVEHGAHDDLLDRNGMYARLHRLSAGAVLS
ncbi:ABC transporter ATP-binding protein [Streptomyces sp. 6-11-2]|uniref:ABC transporter ATP-binding protein n=1 Tax=Streptomyces sp. 6-11-2 TaxID=2585753 RepID=UPI0011412502|nr:ATP-binding cassette domain-containing protein [Streptomyces sp. 6-11-2]GED89862.1 hypothetical protein TNCT6_69470 [Streptomyces sp. 6-11-2]